MSDSADTKNILFCGVGGQGVLKASEICGVAAMMSGYHVKKSEVHGMAQRGGSVESHVRFGKRVFSPLIAPGSTDLVVCFDKGEGARAAHYLKPEGVSFAPYIDLFEENAPDVDQVPGSLNEVLTCLEEDHDFLLEGGVFTDGLIDSWVSWKRKNEVDALRLRPHPIEYEMYYDI